MRAVLVGVVVMVALATVPIVAGLGGAPPVIESAEVSGPGAGVSSAVWWQGGGLAQTDDGSGPIANCTSSPTYVDIGEEVTLDASATEAADYVEFDVDGDGDYDVEDTDDFIESVAYRERGAYEPVVRAVGAGNDTDSCGVVYVGNRPPTAEFSYEPSTPVTGVPVRFNGSESSDVDGAITSYEWLVEGDTVGEGEVINHTFAEATTYRVALIVTDDDNESSRLVRYVTVEPNEPPNADLAASPRPPTVGQQVTLDASNSTDPDGEVVEYRWDFDADGTTDAVTAESTTTHTYAEAGVVTVVVEVVDDDGATDVAETRLDVLPRREEPQADCTVSAEQIQLGETVVIDARETTDASYVEVDVDGDGTYDRTIEGEFVLEMRYGDPGTYDPRLRAVNELAGAAPLTDTAACGEVVVEANEPPIASFTYDPSNPVVNQSVSFDASSSTDPDGEIVEYRWVFDGPGTVDAVIAGPNASHAYADPGNVTVMLVVVDDDGATDEAARLVEIRRPTLLGDLLEGLLLPLLLGGGAAGGLGLLWFLYRTRGPEDDKPRTRYPKPKPSLFSEDVERYAAGTFEIPTAGASTVSITDVGFEPDLILLSTTAASRVDAYPERSQSWSSGIAMRHPEGIEQHVTVVADDALSIDQATVSMTDGDALGASRHGDGPPTLVRGRVVATTPAGFEVAAGIDGEEAETGRLGVLYQAFNLPYEVEVETGHFRMPAEPGRQAIELGVDADHVMLTASSAVGDLDRLWTTDRSIGLSMGMAVGRNDIEQTVRNGTAWPGRDADTAAVGAADRAIQLLYQNGDRIAGQTTAAVLGLGDRLRLRYDRVYSGPEKIGWTEPHVVSYVGMNTAGMMRPAIGTFRLPPPGGAGVIDLGFEPRLVEFAMPGVDKLGRPDTATAVAGPFGGSHGAAVSRDGRLFQYVIQGTGAATPPPGQTMEGAIDPTLVEAGPAEAVADGSGDAVNATADGRVAVSLAVDDTGVISGRDDLCVEAFTETGFKVAVESVSTDGRTPNEETHPYVFYRAWPVVGAATATDPTDSSVDRADPSNADGPGSEPAGGD